MSHPEAETILLFGGGFRVTLEIGCVGIVEFAHRVPKITLSATRRITDRSNRLLFLW